MVEFLKKSPTFYVRDPRQATSDINKLYLDTPVAPSYSGLPKVSLPDYNTLTGQIDTVGLPKSQQPIPYTDINQGPDRITSVPGVTIVDTRNNSYQVDKPAVSINSFAPQTYPSILPSDPSITRLITNGLPAGAVYSAPPTYFNDIGMTQVGGNGSDRRVIISAPSGSVVLKGGITQPLQDIGGVIFPYTPTITMGHKATYDVNDLVHTNYQMPMYRNSQINDITITGEFTANNSDEAKYVLAMMYFFRTATKMFYGQDSIAGTPPPMLFLDGHGSYILPHIPIVLSGFDYTLPNNVDYISIEGSSTDSAEDGNVYAAQVPTQMTVTITCKPTYSRNRASNTFGLERFVTGQLVVGTGPGGGPGGFI